MRKKAISRTFIYIVLIIVAIYTLIPVVAVVTTSVRSEADLAQGPFSLPKEMRILENFKSAWIDGKFNVYFKNSIFITIPTVILVVALSTLAGYSFAKIHFPGANIVFSFMLIGMMIPFQAVMIPLYFLMKNLHLLDTTLGVILIITATSLSFGAFMMRAFFRGLPNELIEAAKLDGCTDLQTFWNVMLPLTIPAWISLIIFQAIWTWNNLLIPLLFLYNDKMRPLPLALYNFQDRYSTMYTLVAAAVMITILPLVVLFILLQRKFVTSITMGAIKG